MMGKGDARNHVEFYNRINLIISVSGWLFKKKSITMHGNMDVKKKKLHYPLASNATVVM